MENKVGIIGPNCAMSSHMDIEEHDDVVVINDKPSRDPFINPLMMLSNPFYDLPMVSLNDGKHVSKYAYRRSPTMYEGAERNKSCPCGSGLKFKRCCEGKPVPKEAEK